MAKLLLITLLLTISLLSSAQTVKTVNTNAGELSSKLTLKERKTITGLTVTGTINEQDFKTIKDSLTALQDLDLSGVIVSQPANKIPDSAFEGCVRLVSVVLPSSVIYLGDYTFENCFNLKKVIFPVALQRIGIYTFYKCVSLTEVEIPSSVSSFGWCTFQNCIGLTSVKLPEGLKYLGGYCFSGCINLKEVNIPDSLLKFETGDFAGCAKIGKIRIPASVERISGNAFGSSDYIFEVDSGNELFSSIDGVMYNKDQTILFRCPQSYSGSFIIPSTVKKISEIAFSGCKYLTSVSFPDSLEEIGAGAFGGCSGLTEITIPPKVDSLQNSVFSNCTKLKSIIIQGSITYIGYNSFRNCFELNSFEIPETTLTIGESAFENIPFDSVYIPFSVQSIGYFAFRGCNCYFNVDPENEKYSSLDGVFFNKDFTYLYYCPPSLEGEYFVPPTVKMIWNYSFVNCNKLTTVHLPKSVSDVGQFAFLSLPCQINVDSENPKLTSLDGVLFTKDMKRLIFCPTSKTGDYYVPETVNTIYELAFYNCVKLTSIHVPASIYFFDANDFFNCKCDVTVAEGCKSIKIVDGVIYSSGMDQLYYCPPSFSGSLKIPSTVKDIRSMAFANCTGLTEITIPESVELIWDSAFFNCIGLKKIHSLDPSPSDVYYSSLPGIESGLFYNLDKNSCELFIPSGSLIYYKNTVQWKDFYNISEYALNVKEDTISIGYDDIIPAEIEVLSNTVWNMTIKSDWLNPDLISGEGDGIIKLTATTNADTISRTATIQLFAAGVDTLNVFVVQEPFQEPESSISLSERSEIKFNNSTGELSFSGDIEGGTIILSDLSGKLILNRKINRHKSIDISHVPTGIYIASLKTSNGLINKKIVRKN